MNYNKKKYIIYAPFFSRSNGVRALYQLYDLLSFQGYEVYMFCSQKCAGYKYIDKIDKYKRKHDIIIYPEIVNGNPLQFQNVVRYVLFFPGKNGGSSTYHSSEIVFTWSKVYYEAPVLYLSGIDTQLFYDEHLPKIQDCYFVHKGGKWKYVEEVEGLLEINMNFPPTREALAKLLKTTRILYSYDAYSALNEEAYLCGAQVKIITEKGFEDFKEGNTFDRKILNAQLNNFIHITQSSNYTGKIEKIPLNVRIFLKKRLLLLYILLFLQRKINLKYFNKKIYRYQQSLKNYGMI